MGEHRVAPRHRTLKGAKIAFGEHFASIDCLVRNVSDTGACLLVESQIGIPERFDLVLNTEKTAKRCRVAWRFENRVGVMFDPTGGAAA